MSSDISSELGNGLFVRLQGLFMKLGLTFHHFLCKFKIYQAIKFGSGMLTVHAHSLLQQQQNVNVAAVSYLTP